MSLTSSARIVLKRLPSRDRERAPGGRERPELVVLGVRPGHAPSAKPPVRIFVGTEVAQHRAERILVWSIERVRDPSRVYEIHLMKELAGFDRSRWLTGFTNYRYAIPELAGGTGRAIYNDVDQIYFTDPAELFDLDMGAAGYLAKSDTETSVMLLDCARMAPLWNLSAARSLHRQELIGKAAATPGLHGALVPEWNSFDEEYVAGRTKVLHFTQLHTQPWQPLPNRFVYQRSPVGAPWYALEREADEAGFHVFTREQPSSRVARLAAELAVEHHAPAAPLEADEAASLREDLALAEAGSVLEVELDGAPAASAALPEPAATPDGAGYPEGAEVRRTTWLEGAPSSDCTCDAVVSRAGLERLPVEDGPWIVEGLFARARRVLWVRLGTRPPAPDLPPGHRPWHPDLDDWTDLFRAIGLRHPDVHWRIVTRDGGRMLTRKGGRLLAREPLVWVLAGKKGGDNSMSVGLAQALGVTFEKKPVAFTKLARPHKRKLGKRAAALPLRLLGLDTKRSAELAPPWPDVVIATGWRPSIVARWIRARSGGRTRLVQMGRKSGQLVDRFDVVVACEHFGLPQHPRRVETLLPLNEVTDERLEEAAAAWPKLFEGAARPRVVVLVGGTTERHRLDAETAWRIGDDARAFAADLGGSVHAVTSRRTGAKATAALAAGLGYAGRLHRYERGSKENPYFAYLAQADVLVVTGESESMISEAAAAGKPLYLYPLPQRSTNLWTRLNDWMVYRAHFRPFKKGAEERRKRRHQQGLEFLLAKGLQHGLVRPRRDTERLNQAVVRRGIAHFFGEPLDTSPRTPLREADEIAPRVRALLGLGARATDGDPSLGSPEPAGCVAGTPT